MEEVEEEEFGLAILVFLVLVFIEEVMVV